MALHELTVRAGAIQLLILPRILWQNRQCSERSLHCVYTIDRSGSTFLWKLTHVLDEPIAIFMLSTYFDRHSILNASNLVSSVARFNSLYKRFQPDNVMQISAVCINSALIKGPSVAGLWRHTSRMFISIEARMGRAL